MLVVRPRLGSVVLVRLVGRGLVDGGCRLGHLDLAGRRHRPVGLQVAVDALDERVQRGADPLPLVGEVPADGVDVALERRAGGLEAAHVLAQARLALLGDAPGLRLGVAHHGGGLMLGVGHQLLGALLGVGDGSVRGALGEHERAAQRLVGVAALTRPLLGTHRALGGLADAVLEVLEPRRDPLEEVVDLFRVVSPPALLELDLAQPLGCQLHGAMLIAGRGTAGDGAAGCERQPNRNPAQWSGVRSTWRTMSTMIGERSKAIPPPPIGGITRRTGASTGSVIVYRKP